MDIFVFSVGEVLKACKFGVPKRLLTSRVNMSEENLNFYISIALSDNLLESRQLDGDEYLTTTTDGGYWLRNNLDY